MHSIKSIGAPLVCGVPECTTISTNNIGCILLNLLERYWFVVFLNDHKQHRMHCIKSIETPLVCGVPECTTISTNNIGCTLLNQLKFHWFVVFLNVLPFPPTTLDALY